MRLPEATAVRAVVVEGFFTRLGFGMVTFALPLYGLSLGMNVAEVGLLAGARALVEPVVKPLAGRFVDRYGVRRGYLGAVSLRLIGSILLFTATTPAALVGVRLLQGAASAARDPASISLIARQSKLRLGRAFSATIGARDLGNVLSGVLAGGILAVTGGSFKVLWAAVVALAVVPVVAVHLSVGRDEAPSPPDPEPEPDPDPDPDPDPEPDLPAAPVVDRHRIRLIGALGLFAGLTAHMTHGLFQVYATEVGGLTPGQVGLIYSISVVTLLATGPAFGWAADRFGTGPLLPVRGIANALSSGLYLVAPSFAGILAARFIDDTGKAAFRPTWGTLMASVVRSPGANRGRAVAKVDALLSVGEALGPVLAGFLWNWQGVAALFIVRAVLGVGTELFIGRRLRNVPTGPDETLVATATATATARVAGAGAAAGSMRDLSSRSHGPLPGGREALLRMSARRIALAVALVTALLFGFGLLRQISASPLDNVPVIQLQRPMPPPPPPPPPGPGVPPPTVTTAPPTPPPTAPAASTPPPPPPPATRSVDTGPTTPRPRPVPTVPPQPRADTDDDGGDDDDGLD